MKTVLITGSSSGIGAETARLFAKKGYSVAINFYKNEKSAMELENELTQQGYSAKAFQCDISDKAQVENLFIDIHAHLGKVDVLINNSAVAQQKLFTDITETDWDTMFDVNVKGAFLCTKEALHDMIEKKSGAIVNVSSMWGETGASCEVHYSSSKAALIGMTKALAKEVGLSGIRVNCVSPGMIDTPMNNNIDKLSKLAIIEETPLNRMGTPADIAKAIFFLASDDASFVTGQIFGVNGGIVI